MFNLIGFDQFNIELYWLFIRLYMIEALSKSLKKIKKDFAKSVLILVGNFLVKILFINKQKGELVCGQFIKNAVYFQFQIQ